MAVAPAQIDGELADDRGDVALRPGPEEQARMAERLRQMDELSQFLVAMRDAVQSKLRDA